MERSLSGVVLILLLISVSNVLLATGERCPTYQTNLVVDIVDSIPQSAWVGTAVVTTVHVIYPDGTPVTLYPQTVSFVWSSNTGQKVFENAAVVPTGDPGFYTYTETVTEYFPTGIVTISVLYCSCSDVPGNRGPTDDVDSDTTMTAADNSRLNIGPTTPPQPTTHPLPPPPPPSVLQLLTTYAVPIVIVALLIIALLLLLIRTRWKAP